MEKEDVWKKIASGLKYCHGTSSVFDDSIKISGIVPRQQSGKSVYEKDLISKHDDAVYLGVWTNGNPTFCHAAADNAVKKYGGEHRVYDIKLNSKDFDNFRRDEDSWSDNSYDNLFPSQCKFSLEYKQPSGCMEKPILHELTESIKNGQLTEEEACNPPWWFRELACFGRFGIKDGINRSKITATRERKSKGNMYIFPEI